MLNDFEENESEFVDVRNEHYGGEYVHKKRIKLLPIYNTEKDDNGNTERINEEGSI